MSDIINIVTELGSFGLLLALAGWIVVNHFKNNGKEHDKNSNVVDIAGIASLLNENTKEIKDSINAQGKRIDNVEQSLSIQMNQVHERINEVEDKYDRTGTHTKQFTDRLKLGPQLHKSLNAFRSRINADHIFIGSFHNGNESLTGIPYYKFDIIAERFRPDKVDRDIEFAFMYKDADLLRHDLLPTEVVQRNTVKYIIDENGDSDLKEIDDIIYRRMIGRNIKQLAISLLRDPSGTPSGFVGCVRYDYEDIDLEELRACGDELEQIYAANDKLISSKNIK